MLKLEDRLEAEQVWVAVAGIQFPSQVVGMADILHKVKIGEGKEDARGVQGTGVVMADGLEVGADPGFEVVQKLEVVLQKLLLTFAPAQEYQNLQHPIHVSRASKFFRFHLHVVKL